MTMFSSLIGNCVYEISSPPKEISIFKWNFAFMVNLTKNPTNIYQVQVADCGETTDKFDIQ